MTAQPGDISEIQQLQSAGEGVELIDDRRIEFLGEHFAIRGKVGLMPLMRFAMTAKSGTDTDDLESLVALYKLLQSCIAEHDWQRFGDHADATSADADDLLEVVGATIEQITARPTRRPAVSSAGPQTTSESSKGPSTLRLVQGYGDGLETAEQMRARLTA